MKTRRTTEQGTTAPGITDQGSTTPAITSTTPSTATVQDERLARAHATWAYQDPDGLPAMGKLQLPGPYRKKRNRGGATAIAVTMRILIRSPLIHHLADTFTSLTSKTKTSEIKSKGGRPATPPAYWFFYAALARELASYERADKEVESHWDLIQAEFAAQGHNVRRTTTRDGSTKAPGYDGFEKWRNSKLLQDGPDGSERVPTFELRRVFERWSELSLDLAALIRQAEGRATGDPLRPSLGEILAGDATVMRMPSEVHTTGEVDPATGQLAVVGSRATGHSPRSKPRVHRRGYTYSVKEHGPQNGWYYLALSAKGVDTYTTVLLDLDIAEPGVAESDAVFPMLQRTLSRAGQGYFLTLAYDGQMYPKHGLQLAQEYAVLLANHNAIRSNLSREERRELAAQPGLAGSTQRRRGHHRGTTVGTYFTALPRQIVKRADGGFCLHYLVSDDGAIYLADRAQGAGSAKPKKVGPPIPPVEVMKSLLSDGTWQIKLIYQIPCEHGPHRYAVDITDPAQVNSKGQVSWSSNFATHRAYPDAIDALAKGPFGARNQVESAFSWLERRYEHKDRAAAWGHGAQLVDLLMAGVLINTEAWAHYVYRYPHAQQAPSADPDPVVREDEAA